MFGYGGSCVLTGAVTITLIGAPVAAPPLPPAVVPSPLPALEPPAVVAVPLPAVEPPAAVAAPPAVVVAAADVAWLAELSSSPQAPATSANAATTARPM